MRAMIRTSRLAPTTTITDVITLIATDWSTARRRASAASLRDLSATATAISAPSAMLIQMFAMTETSQLPTRPNHATMIMKKPPACGSSR